MDHKVQRQVEPFIIYGIDAAGQALEDAGLTDMTEAEKERQLKAITHETAENAAQYAAQTERLEARVRVLERIVTDKGIDVADEIEKLRDAPLN